MLQGVGRVAEMVVGVLTLGVQHQSSNTWTQGKTGNARGMEVPIATTINYGDSNTRKKKVERESYFRDSASMHACTRSARNATQRNTSAAHQTFNPTRRHQLTD